MVKHNFWSVKGYLKNNLKKKKRKTKNVQKKICVKILLKNWVLGKKSVIREGKRNRE
jgi:hypothetical protein